MSFVIRELEVRRHHEDITYNYHIIEYGLCVVKGPLYVSLDFL